tara:strand:- start:221 stop:517 length:297 start_codon:yes stop_codon:yes gene_type:complete
MTTQPKHNYIKILMEYLVWVNGITFANDMYDREEPDDYTIGKFRIMQDKLSTYLCNLDTFNQMKLLQLAMEYHENRDRVIQRSHWYMERNLQKEGEQK